MDFWMTHLKKNRWVWMITLICFVLCRGSMLFSNVIGIDTEAIIRSPKDLAAGWMGTGRQGLVFLKSIFFDSFNPVFSGIGTVVFMMAACFLWTGMLAYVSKRENVWANLSFCLCLSVSVILTEQFYFKLQSMETSIAFCMIAIALHETYRFAAEGKKSGLLLAIPTMFLAFCSYQVMVALYLAGACICFYLYVMQWLIRADEQDVTFKEILLFVGKYVILFLAVFFSNQLVTKIWFSQGDYLSNQIYWTREEPLACIWNIVRHVGGVLLGSNIYYCKSFLFYVILFLAFGFILILVDRKKKMAGTFLMLAHFSVLMTPFIMTILLGGQPVIRSQLVYPFVLAFLAFVLALYLELLIELSKGGNSRACRHIEIKQTVWKTVLAMLLLFTCFLQGKYSAALNYSDSVRYQNDVRLAEEIIRELDATTEDGKACPIIFFGKREATLNSSCIQGETMGHSFFEWDVEVEPKGYYNSMRILGFMNTLGRTYPNPTIEQVAQAQAFEEKMEIWPNEGSVLKQNGVIIIKLSE